MRRKRLLLFGVFVVAVLAAGWLLIPFEAPRISQANFDKIQQGWSLEQVEELLGKGFMDSSRISGYVTWFDDDGNSIWVLLFDARVQSKAFKSTDRTFFQRTKGRVERRLQTLWP
jgi:hypothetical protein